MLQGELKFSEMARSEVEDLVLKVLNEQYRSLDGPLPLDCLIQAMREHDVPPSAVREAIWLLMDRGYVDLTVDRNIEPTGKARASFDVQRSNRDNGFGP